MNLLYRAAAATVAQGAGSSKPALTGRPSLRVRFGLSVRLGKPGLNTTFPVPLLLADYLPHQGGLVGFVQLGRLPGHVVVGAPRRRFFFTHGQTSPGRDFCRDTRPEPLCSRIATRACLVSAMQPAPAHETCRVRRAGRPPGCGQVFDDCPGRGFDIVGQVGGGHRVLAVAAAGRRDDR